VIDHGTGSYARSMHEPSSAEHRALLALLTTRLENSTWQQLTTDVLNAGRAQAVWDSSAPPQLIPDPARAAAVERADADLRAWRQRGLRFVSVLDRAYPRQLRDIHQVPPFLFVAGELIQDDVAVSVVGSRKASLRGLEIAASIARALVRRNLTVVSGLAAGIDTAAHGAALDEGGRTVAIIGTGITQYYPKTNRQLQDMIADKGLVLSQFWPDAPPTRSSFPMRNAVMSGYGVASVIVEASEHSGARIQARLAVEHGRPVILTDGVVEATVWGRELTGQPDVHVASSTAQVIDIVTEIEQRRAALPGLLSALALG
jgi:DNA processing protein